MTVKSVSEILADIDKSGDRLQMIEALRRNSQNQGMMAMLFWAFDPRIHFNLASTDPPFEPCQFLDQYGALQTKIGTIQRVFIADQSEPRDKRHALKREMAFIGILESVDPLDAELLLAVKNKHLPERYAKITRDLVAEAFPGFLAESP